MCESPPWVRTARCGGSLKDSTHGRQAAPRRQSLGLGPTGLSGYPRTDGNMPTGVRAPVLGFWPLRVSTHERQQPLGVRAPVPGRSQCEENDGEREGEEGDVADQLGEPPRALPTTRACLGAVTPMGSPARPGNSAARSQHLNGTWEIARVWARCPLWGHLRGPSQRDVTSASETVSELVDVSRRGGFWGRRRGTTTRATRSPRVDTEPPATRLCLGAVTPVGSPARRTKRAARVSARV